MQDRVKVIVPDLTPSKEGLDWLSRHGWGSMRVREVSREELLETGYTEGVPGPLPLDGKG